MALKNVSLTTNSEFFPVKSGEFVMIRGPSGGGKTTLLNLIGTIDSPSDGELHILQNKIESSSSDDFLSQLRLKHIGFVFQTFNLLATMSALENVELPMILLGKHSEKERRKRAIELLKRVGLGDRLDHLPSEMSGGEQQRVAISRALANEPDILLLDEPTGDLDSRSTIQVMDLILHINRVGPRGDGEQSATTCVMVTHNPELECYADRILYV
jgi:putative ABC transport system ATP-binding protein